MNTILNKFNISNSIFLKLSNYSNNKKEADYIKKDNQNLNIHIEEFYYRTMALIVLFILLIFLIIVLLKNLLFKTKINQKYQTIRFMLLLYVVTMMPLNLFIIHYSSKFININVFKDVYKDVKSTDLLNTVKKVKDIEDINTLKEVAKEYAKNNEGQIQEKASETLNRKLEEVLEENQNNDDYLSLDTKIRIKDTIKNKLGSYISENIQ